MKIWILFQNQNIVMSTKDTPKVNESHRIISEHKQLKPTVYAGTSPTMKQQQQDKRSKFKPDQLISDQVGWITAYAAETTTSYESASVNNEITQRMIAMAEETQLNDALFGNPT